MTEVKLSLDIYPIELIIFDCDGVLIDSEILSKRVLLNMLSMYGIKLSDDYFYTHFLGHNFEHVTAKVLDDFNVTLTSDFRLQYRQNLVDIFSKELKPTEQLEWLLSQVNVKSCVATSSSPARVEHSLSSTKLNSYFSDCVFTSSEVEKGKPAPDLFLYAADKMGVSPENCLVIEDSNAGIKAAMAANMQVIRYAGASHMKNISHVTDGIKTITHWNQLVDMFPKLFTSVNRGK